MGKAIILSSEKDKNNFNELLFARRARHVVASTLEPPNKNLVISLILKLISSPNFRIQFDIGKNVKFLSEKIASVSDITPQFERLIGNIHLIKNFEGAKESLRKVANELAMKSVFNAPIGEDGQHRYKTADRTEMIKLTEKEKVGYCFF